MKMPGPAGEARIAIGNRARRARYYRLTAGKCFYCGNPVRNKDCSDGRDWLLLMCQPRMVREHMTPVIRGGTDARENLVTACGDCNAAKGSFTLDEYRMVLGLRSSSLNFRFGLEPAADIRRDWLCCHSPAQERSLLIHNIPAAAEAYRLRNAWARGPRARAGIS